MTNEQVILNFLEGHTGVSTSMVSTGDRLLCCNTILAQVYPDHYKINTTNYEGAHRKKKLDLFLSLFTKYHEKDPSKPVIYLKDIPNRCRSFHEVPTSSRRDLARSILKVLKKVYYHLPQEKNKLSMPLQDTLTEYLRKSEEFIINIANEEFIR